MRILTVTAKGQMTLRKDDLAHLGVSPGDKVAIEIMPGGRIEMSAAPNGKISSAFGLLERPKRAPLSVEQIDEIAAQGWAGKR
jgi:bifunctional DNA-binding transcriptional regulator/antitoxin component of YhaV-PrlF toxin-antitoxin module